MTPQTPKSRCTRFLRGKDYGDGLVCVGNADVIGAMVRASRESKALELLVDEENKIQIL